MKIECRHQNLVLLTLSLMNQLLKKGFILFCLIHPAITIVCLNILLSMSLHESLHISFYRLCYKRVIRHIYISQGSLSVYVHLEDCKLFNFLICLSPALLSLIGAYLFFFTKYNLFISVPWLLNMATMFPLSRDMKTFLRSLK